MKKYEVINFTACKFNFDIIYYALVEWLQLILRETNNEI